ncbi:NAD(P)/FAD-dependent oxidoreductase [Methylocystis sp. L43]|jgi:nitrite reductase (NADH) large subunit|uniref:NAD(P)/FAD-dependent oxidoreductase n=1 Tax=unclassified Methylocystis TaxID=2625913 RepID=UPI0018C23BBB|nr:MULTISPECIES: FAD-dependent oxidoreductase [unclassified Methylocystis]MBG0799060.1 NAD(P)/FAD-dependent oxidoreductase [Methylocystis sp. L43]MBG0806565.1 NAD(P)/FAD-dependent oxidoreductase [Methylocystis sp. H15]
MTGLQDCKSREKLVVVGAGMAATRFVEELTNRAPDRYDILVIGDEPRLAYNRVLLSSVLAGEMSVDDIELKPSQWWRAAGVEVLSGRKVVEINAAARRILLDKAESVDYSKIVLATGSRAARLPIEGADLPGVHVFRDVTDVEALSRLGREMRALVIGGGLLGLEAAYGLARRGVDVTLAHVMDRLMERQLDAAGADILRRLVEEKGVRVLLNANATRICGGGRVEKVEFADGRMIPVGAVIFAVGIHPNADLARQAGLDVGRGVKVDDALKTSEAGVFAIGECAEHRGVCYGLVEPAYEQGRVLAMRLAGQDASYGGSVVSTNLKVSGVRVFSAGDYLGEGDARRIVCKDPRMGIYRKLVVRDDRLVGAILVGDTNGGADILDLIRSGADISSQRDQLLFGAPMQEAA